MENAGKRRRVARFHTIHSNSHFFALFDAGQADAPVPSL